MRYGSAVSIMLLIGVAVLVPAAPATAQGAPVPDLAGQWLLSTDVLLEGETVPCHFEGLARIMQDGTELSGEVTLGLVTGPAACPPEMTAQLSGGLEIGTEVYLFGQLGGDLGALNFSGQISPNPGGGGDFNVTQGMYMGLTGTWAAELLESVLQIPTLTAVGLTLLTLLLLGAGALLLRHATSTG